MDIARHPGTHLIAKEQFYTFTSMSGFPRNTVFLTKVNGYITGEETNI